MILVYIMYIICDIILYFILHMYTSKNTIWLSLRDDQKST